MAEEKQPSGNGRVVWSALFHLAESLIRFRTRSLERIDEKDHRLSPVDRFCLEFYDHLINCYLRERLRNLDIAIDVAYRRYMKDKETSLVRLLRRVSPKNRREYRKFLDELDKRAESINTAFIRSQPIPIDVIYAEDPRFKSLAEKQVYQILSFEEQILDLIHPLTNFEGWVWKLEINRNVSDKFVNELRQTLDKIPADDHYFVVYGLSNLRDLKLELEEKEEYTQDVFDLHLDDKIRKSHDYYLRAINDFHTFLENLETLSTNKFYVAKKSYEIALNYRNEVLNAVKRLLSPPTKLANDPDALRQAGISRLKQGNLLFPGGDPLKILTRDSLLKDVGCNRKHVIQEVDYLRRNPGGQRKLSNIKIRLAVNCLDNLAAEVEAHNREARAIYMEKIVLQNLRSIGFTDDDGRSIYLRAVREGMSEIGFNILVIQMRDHGDRSQSRRLLEAAFLLEEQGRLVQAIKGDDRTRKLFNLYGVQGPKELALVYALIYYDIAGTINRAFLNELADNYDSETSAITGQLTPAKLLLERAMRDYINVAGLQFSRSTHEDTLEILELSATDGNRLNSPALRQQGVLYRLIPRISIEVFRWAVKQHGPAYSVKELSDYLRGEMSRKADPERLEKRLGKLEPLWDKSLRVDKNSFGPLEVDEDLKSRLTKSAGFNYFQELELVSGIIDRFRSFGIGFILHQAMNDAKTLLPIISSSLELPTVKGNRRVEKILKNAAEKIGGLADHLEEV